MESGRVLDYAERVRLRCNYAYCAEMCSEIIETIFTETKLPQLSVVSWVYASPDGTRIKIALGHKASSIVNIRNNPNVTIGIIGAGSCFSAQGIASVSNVIERTMKLVIVTIDIKAVENVMFYGGKVTVEPAYEKTYNPDLAKKLDAEVYQLLSS